MSEEKSIEIVQDVNPLNVLGADPVPFQPTDVVWSRSETEAKDRRGTFIPGTGLERLSKFVMRRSPMRRSTMVFGTPEGQSGAGLRLVGSGTAYAWGTRTE